MGKHKIELLFITERNRGKTVVWYYEKSFTKNMKSKGLSNKKGISIRS